MFFLSQKEKDPASDGPDTVCSLDAAEDAIKPKLTLTQLINQPQADADQRLIYISIGTLNIGQMFVS